MAKRFTSTEIWGEDWFLDMPNDYKLFWYYILSNCDHSGIFKVNLRSFCGLLEVKINTDEALKYFNKDKDRIQEITKNLWFIKDFFVFQYGTTFNINNRLHFSIKSIYDKYDIKMSSIRGLREYNDTLKDKDKDKDIVKNKEDKKELEKTININFDYFWDLYDKKVGDKQKLIKKWEALTGKDRELAMTHIPRYKIAQPDKKYRKDPQTYLNNKSWNDEIISSSGIIKPQREVAKVDNREYWEIHYGHLGKTKEEIMEMVANGELE